jgi:thioredoxin 1
MIKLSRSRLVSAGVLVCIFAITCAKKDSATTANNDNPSMQKQVQNMLQQTEIAALPADQPPDTQKAESIGAIKSLDELNAIVDKTPGKLLVFDLYADWCAPCRMLAPTYDSIAKQHANNAAFYRVDVQRHQDVAAAFGVQGIPLVVFIKDKKVVQRVTGLNPRAYYERVITTCGPSVSAEECKKQLDGAL